MRSSGIAAKIGAFGAGFFGALWLGGTAGTLVYKLVSVVAFGKWPEVPLADVFPSLVALPRSAPDVPELTPAVSWLGQADLLTAFAVFPLVCLLCCLALVERPGEVFPIRSKPRTIYKSWNEPPAMFGRPRRGGPGPGRDTMPTDKARPAS